MASIGQIVATIVINFIILVIGSAILNALANKMIKGAKRKGFGTAFGVMIIWFIIDTVLTLTGVGLILGLLMLLVYWILFALLIMGFYKCSFGRGLLVAFVFALIIFLLAFLLLITVGAIILLIILI